MHNVIDLTIEYQKKAYRKVEKLRYIVIICQISKRFVSFLKIKA